MTLVYVGGPVANRAWILPTWIERVRSQDIETRIVAAVTESEDKTMSILEEAGADILYDPFLKSRSIERTDAHIWEQSAGEYRYMANLRNNVVDFVQRRTEADYFFSLDSDILLAEPNQISRLIETLTYVQGGAISPLVNMGQAGAVYWNYMFDTAGGPKRRPSPPPHSVFEVGAIMAAILMDPFAMQARWGDHELGEDLAWNADAGRIGVRKWIDPTITLQHIMKREEP